MVLINLIYLAGDLLDFRLQLLSSLVGRKLRKVLLVIEQVIG